MKKENIDRNFLLLPLPSAPPHLLPFEPNTCATPYLEDESHSHVHRVTRAQLGLLGVLGAQDGADVLEEGLVGDVGLLGCLG